jgi:hypothetical protein
MHYQAILDKKFMRKGDNCCHGIGSMVKSF